jgi:hypothetical protein
MIDIKTFVAQSITQICQGVAEATRNTTTLGALVSPKGINFNSSGNAHLDPNMASNVRVIEFDIAVTVNNTTGGQAAVGIFVAAVGANSGGENDNDKSTTSRIRFTVPVCLPNAPRT